MEKRESFYSVGDNVNRYPHYGKQYEYCLEILELPYDTEIQLLGIYSDKNIIQKDQCTSMFIAALFTIAETWKQPKCPLTDE